METKAEMMMKKLDDDEEVFEGWRWKEGSRENHGGINKKKNEKEEKTSHRTKTTRKIKELRQKCFKERRL